MATSIAATMTNMVIKERTVNWGERRWGKGEEMELRNDRTWSGVCVIQVTRLYIRTAS
jgi:hypothetical protein